MTKLAAVIVETRPLSNLVEIIQGHMKFLPEYTQLIIFGSNQNEYLREEFPESAFCYCEENIDVVKYNQMLTSVEFWKQLSYHDRVLIFQHDSMLLRKGIADFYAYHFCGSPWPFQSHGGNGGLSLRDPKLMMEICNNYAYNYNVHGNEDVHICNIMHNNKIGNLAPHDICSKFSVESIEAYGTLGYHAIEKYLSPEICEKIKNQYT